MAYAVIEVGGRQHTVEPGSRLEVNRVAVGAGSTLTVDRVLLAHDGQALQVGRPYVAGAKVVCEVVEHRRGPKVIAYHYRRRENWRKTVGHRQPLSRLVVKEILCAGGGAVAEASVGQEARPAAMRASTVKAKAPKLPSARATSKPSPRAAPRRKPSS